MESRGTSVRRALGVVVALVACASVSACLNYILTPSYTPEIRWKEEVRLHDGRIIVVEQWAKRGGRSEPGQPPMALWSEIKAKNPVTGAEVAWREDSASGAYVFDFVGEIAYVAVSVGLYPACKKYGFPESNFVFFRYDGEWKRISYSEFPPMLDTNLFLSAWRAERLGLLEPLMTLDKQSAYNRRYRYGGEYSMRRLMETGKRSACARFDKTEEYKKAKESKEHRTE